MTCEHVLPSARVAVSKPGRAVPPLSSWAAPFVILPQAGSPSCSGHTNPTVIPAQAGTPSWSGHDPPPTRRLSKWPKAAVLLTSPKISIHERTPASGTLTSFVNRLLGLSMTCEHVLPSARVAVSKRGRAVPHCRPGPPPFCHPGPEAQDPRHARSTTDPLTVILPWCRQDLRHARGTPTPRSSRRRPGPRESTCGLDPGHPPGIPARAGMTGGRDDWGPSWGCAGVVEPPG